MEQSILKSTKKILNIGEDDASFDHDIVTHINSAFSHLQQMGIGPEAGFIIDSDEEEWGDFLEAPLPILSLVKTNVYLRVRGYFDPPQLPHVMAAMKEQLLESDVRLSNLREGTDWVNPNPLDPIPQILDLGEAI